MWATATIIDQWVTIYINRSEDVDGEVAIIKFDKHDLIDILFNSDQKVPVSFSVDDTMYGKRKIEQEIELYLPATTFEDRLKAAVAAGQEWSDCGWVINYDDFNAPKQFVRYDAVRGGGVWKVHIYKWIPEDPSQTSGNDLATPETEKILEQLRNKKRRDGPF